MSARYLNPGCMPPPPGLFSWVAQSERLVFLAGQVGITRDNKLAGPDAESQSRQIYANIEATLKELGGDLNCLLRTQIYVVGRQHIAGHRKVRKELIDSGRLKVKPASTLLVVAGLAEEQWLVEVEGVALLP